MKQKSPILSIARFTAADELHNKSFFVLLAVCIALIMIIRGCYKGEYMVNGQHVEGLSVAWHVAIAAYHAVALFGLFTALILSSHSFRRDRANGTATFILSRPVSRFSYVAGKILGLWTVCFVFMFILHITVFLMTLTVSGGTLPMLPVASLLNGINILFTVCMLCLLSLLVPEFIALVIGAGVLSVSFISDSIQAVLGNQAVQSALQQSGGTSLQQPSWWRLAWPKVASLQYYGSSIIQDKPFTQIGPLHPAINIAIFCAILFVLVVYKIRYEEL